MKKRILAALMSVMMAFTTLGVPVFAEETVTGSANAEESEMAEAEEPYEVICEEEVVEAPAKKTVITGFAPFDSSAATIHQKGRPSLKALRSMMPETLKAYTESGEVVDVKVNWESAGYDYDATKLYFYAFVPTIADDRYEAEEDVDSLEEGIYAPVYVEESYEAPALNAVTTNENEGIIFKFLVGELGFNNAAACGVLANFYAESKFDPHATGDNGTSYGIAQWHEDRWTSLKNFCNENGYDWKTLDGQLEYIRYELSANRSGVLYNGKKIYDYMVDVTNDEDGAYDAGYYWCYYYERPAKKETGSVTRGNMAADTYWPVYKDMKVTATVKLDTPVLKASKTSAITNQKVTLSWNTVEGATQYVLTGMLGSKKVLSETVTSKRSYDVSFTTYGTYTYSITASSGRVSKKSADVSIKVYLPAPELTGTEPVSNGIKIKWKAMDGVPNYRVYRKTEGGSYAKVATVTGTSYVDKTAESGVTYYYTVRAFDKAGTTYISDYNKNGVKGFYVEQPVLASIESVFQGMRITWAKSAGAEQYRVYRKTEGASWKQIGLTTGNRFVDETPESGVTYFYTVRAVNKANNVFTSSYDTKGISLKYIAAPVLKSLTNTADGLKITWEKSAGAARYRVYRLSNEGKWMMLGSTTGNSWNDTYATSGTEFSYTVRCFNADNSAYVSGYDPVGLKTMRLSQPSVSMSNQKEGVKVSWSTVTGADSYRVYRKTKDTSWKLLGQMSGNSYVDPTAVSGETYYYTVRAAYGTVYSTYVNNKTIERLEEPTVTLDKVNDGVKISWTSVKGAAKYRVYRKTQDATSWSRIAEVDAISSTNFVDKTGKAGTLYYYTVRAVDGDYLGSYIKTLSISY